MDAVEESSVTGDAAPGTVHRTGRVPHAPRRDEWTVFEPTSGWGSLRLGELWRSRELLYALVSRDVRVRYKQTVVGALWAILQPALMALVFTIIFGHLVRVPSDGVPYAAFAYAGLLPWLLFARSLTDSSTSLVVDKELITKVSFPRLTIPTASVLAAVVDFVIASAGVLALMAWYRIEPTPKLLTLPLWIALAVVTALAVGTWLSALNVQYRDVQYTLPFLTQLWLFATPIAYSASVVPERFHVIYGLNPIAGGVTGFRWALFPEAPAPGLLLVVSTVVTVVLLVTGVWYFRRTERTFADVV